MVSRRHHPIATGFPLPLRQFVAHEAAFQPTGGSHDPIKAFFMELKVPPFLLGSGFGGPTFPGQTRKSILLSKGPGFLMEVAGAVNAKGRTNTDTASRRSSGTVTFNGEWLQMSLSEMEPNKGITWSYRVTAADGNMAVSGMVPAQTLTTEGALEHHIRVINMAAASRAAAKH
jgi:hypothetical protein